mgnify:FL=1|tara:strand:- start:463 stop:720 length:258 start_codon:yes stop_codon:yes gene_type:complete
MIIQLEIEQMIAELKRHDSDKAKDYINVLNRTLMEMREQNNALKQSMVLTANSEIDGLNLLKENAALKERIEQMNKLINSLNETE